jgi:hypothetical protein
MDPAAARLDIRMLHTHQLINSPAPDTTAT